ncbi:hypothetical protein J1605_017056 [Eschrichtius robustus]|uniref:Uncharacterized protein n=1 Tax=Eschrichtius robustus TaxID=9764 RepID=A0AB34I5M9_ESCRO|nr:hypothetical protein J1605_017056 [Eschrichtius robustus]
MVQVWYMEESQDDLRWPPGLEPSCPVLLEQLHQLGVLYWKLTRGISLVAQWLRIRLLMQGTWVRALVREDLTCCGATKPVRHNY